MRVATQGLRRVLGLNALGRFFGRSAAPTDQSLFHVTHHKAGSQWILRILHGLAGERCVPSEVESAQFLGKPLVAGAVYPTVYVTREQFESVALPKNWKRFVVIRDIRDTLVSAYFSFKHSHPVVHDRAQELRDFYRSMTVEEGLLHMAKNRMAAVAQMQWSWVASGEELIKYEDLLTRDEEILERVLLRGCGLNVPRARFLQVVRANRFQARSGRKPGEEDIGSHERKGVAGDWRNHFTDRIAKAMHERFASLLIATGYEKGFNW
jgi:lipopolysaccharide transport system ATP-binding protein